MDTEQFIKDYDKIRRRVQRKIFYKKLELSPDDFINDTLIYFTETKKPYDFNSFVEKAKWLIITEAAKNVEVSLIDNGKIESKTNGVESIFCVKCKNDLHISNYRLKFQKGSYFYGRVCRECLKRDAKEYYQRNKDKIISHQIRYQKTRPQRYALLKKLSALKRLIKKGADIDVNPKTYSYRTKSKHGKYRGVSFRKSITAIRKYRDKNGHERKYEYAYQCSKPYEALIYYKNKRIYLGRFKTEIEAALAHDKKAIELKGDKANLNFSINS